MDTATEVAAYRREQIRQKLSRNRFVPAKSIGFHSCSFVSIADVALLGNVVQLNGYALARTQLPACREV